MLAYISKTTTEIVVTITASSPGADSKKIQVTLTTLDLISISSTATSISYLQTATISAICNTGAAVTLTASGTG